MRKMYSVAFATAAAMAVALPASSLTVSVTSLSFGIGNSADSSTEYNANASAVQTLDSGGTVADAVSATEDAQVRYAANSWADVYDGFGSDPDTDISLTHSYDVTFTITADAGTVYDIAIDAIFAGMIKQVNDDYWGYAQANVGGGFSVTLDQNGGGASSQSILEGSGASFAYDYSDVSQGFNDTGQLVLSDLTGTTTLAFSVSFDSRVRSWTDDVGLLLGLDQPFATPSPDDSPEASLYATSGRTIADDGHFLGVSANVTSVNPVPEPSTAPLLGLGLLLLGLHRKRA